MASAMPQDSRVSPRSAVTGRVSSPKLVRMPLVTAASRQPAMISSSSGAAMEREAVTDDMAQTSKSRRTLHLQLPCRKCIPVMRPITQR